MIVTYNVYLFWWLWLCWKYARKVLGNVASCQKFTLKESKKVFVLNLQLSCKLSFPVQIQHTMGRQRQENRNRNSHLKRGNKRYIAVLRSLGNLRSNSANITNSPYSRSRECDSLWLFTLWALGSILWVIPPFPCLQQSNLFSLLRYVPSVLISFELSLPILVQASGTYAGTILLEGKKTNKNIVHFPWTLLSFTPLDKNYIPKS